MIGKYIDHTLLSPTATETEYSKLALEAIEYNLKAICVPPTWTYFCKKIIDGSQVKLATVVGFPLGYSLTQDKLCEVHSMVKIGVDEIDFVSNLSWAKSGKFDRIKDEFKSIRDAAPQVNLKAILETGALTVDEISKLCDLSIAAGLDFIKTSTGFYKVGARIEDVELMKKCVGHSIKIKASGGISSYKSASAFLDAGANRLGCSSSLKILHEEKK